MTDHPMIFSSPMIRALQREAEAPGTGKTQTRRLLNRFRVFATQDTVKATLKGDEAARALLEAANFRNLGGDSWTWTAKAFDYQAPATRTIWYAHLPYAVGDKLWVREAWRTFVSLDYMKPHQIWPRPGKGAGIAFEAGGGMSIGSEAADGFRHVDYGSGPREDIKAFGKRRVSMFMPRWASRLTLTVTDVRVQRLHDISNEDCIAEGVEEHPNEHAPRTGPAIDEFARKHGLISHYGAEYKRIWNSIHGKKSWSENLWVCAISFDVARANIDSPPKREAA